MEVIRIFAMRGKGTQGIRRLRRPLAACLLATVLALPGPARAEAFSDMFGFMFRMMLTMMNVMSSATDNNSSGWGGWPGGSSPFGSGMTAWPLMSNMYGLGGWPGSGWSGMQNPAGYQGTPPTPSREQHTVIPIVVTAGTGDIVPFPHNARSLLLDGSWYGTTGEILRIRGNRFSLRNGLIVLNGIVKLHNNVLTLYTPQTNNVQVYTFARNLSDLVLQDRQGKILTFRKYPGRFGNRLHIY